MDDYLHFGGFSEIAFMRRPETIGEIHYAWRCPLRFPALTVIAIWHRIKMPIGI